MEPERLRLCAFPNNEKKAENTTRSEVVLTHIQRKFQKKIHRQFLFLRNHLKVTATHFYTWVKSGSVRVECPWLGLEPRPLDSATCALTMRPPCLPQKPRLVLNTVAKIRETKEKQYQSCDVTYGAAISDDFRPEGGFGGGMIFHFIGTLEFDGVLSFFPGHGVTARIRNVLIGEIA